MSNLEDKTTTLSQKVGHQLSSITTPPSRRTETSAIHMKNSTNKLFSLLYIAWTLKIY
jgi:hypothetical protein